jgi:hypothetical protein
LFRAASVKEVLFKNLLLDARKNKIQVAKLLCLDHQVDHKYLLEGSKHVSVEDLTASAKLSAKFGKDSQRNRYQDADKNNQDEETSLN